MIVYDVGFVVNRFDVVVVVFIDVVVEINIIF